MQDLVDKLQSKVKTYKKQAEEAEEVMKTALNSYINIEFKLEILRSRM